MYFYVIEGARGRPGFGITGNIKDRAKSYSSHMGEVANFPRIYTGNPRHIRALEKRFKSNSDIIWEVEGWKTEWLDGVTMPEFLELVTTIIGDLRYDVSLVTENYNHTQEIT